MAKQVMPEAELEPRDTDLKLTDDEYLQISLFAQLKRKPSLDKYPGALVLRRFRKGEVICRQGEAGWTAFYILTSEDELTLQERMLPAWKGEEARSRRDVLATLRARVEMLKSGKHDEDLRRAATVHLNVARPSVRLKKGWVSRVTGGWFGDKPQPAKQQPSSIIIDGPTDVDYSTLQASLLEGELFGEMSCLYGTPRSATIIAARDCCMLEILRNLLDQLQKDPAFKAQTDEVYRRRVVQLYLRRLSLFSHLTEQQFDSLRNELELVSYEAGQIICDENERPDCMYIIRSGLVRVVKKVTALLGTESIRSWSRLAAALQEGEPNPATPRGKLWQLLSEKGRAAVVALTGTGQSGGAEQLELLYALNELIKNPRFSEAREFLGLTKEHGFREKAQEIPENRKEWSEQEARRFNRLLIEAILPDVVRGYRKRVGPDCVLSYCAQGEFIGEMGLVSQQPRTATCVAHGHPGEDAKVSGRVELVRISEKVFQRLMALSPVIREKVERKAAERLKQAQERAKTPVWDDSDQVFLSEGFLQLGLIQGQKLMLIDLDRCTRCDECVRACVNTHDDGHTRLFLDGPRFGKYLVPTSCRSCLDPVCMIGCPVGSIHRGDNNQIIIEDWCIGCGLCAGNCPYGSIQMHDIGIIPGDALGWRLMPAAQVSDNQWYLPKYRDQHWVQGRGPFRFDREFQATLAELRKPKGGQPVVPSNQPICFRYEFNLGSYLLGPASQFKMEVRSADANLMVWVNGQELQSEKPKGGKREYWLPPKAAASEHGAPKLSSGGAAAPTKKPGTATLWRTGPAPAAAPAPLSPPPRPAAVTQFLRAGRNVVAVKVMPTGSASDLLLELRLDEVRQPEVPGYISEEVTEKLVTERAVVCDLCSDRYGQVPACVNACPHDAAMRVDARFQFPIK